MADHLSLKETDKRVYPLNIKVRGIEALKSVRILVNGTPASEEQASGKEKGLKVDVPLSAGMNRITAIAYDKNGFSSMPKFVDVNCKTSVPVKSNLYLLAVGVSEYPNLPKDWQLAYAHSDAKALSEAFRWLKGKLFEAVNVKVLYNKDATVGNIAESLKAFQSAGPNDVVVISLIGHGARNSKGDFYFLTAPSDYRKPEEQGLSWDVLKKQLDSMKDRVVLLLDACHSGAISHETVVPNDELAQRLFADKKAGVIVFSSSKGRQESLESSKLGGGFGLFTYAVTNALGRGAVDADYNENGYVEFMELVDYVVQLVEKESDGMQTPWLARRELLGDFPIAPVSK